MTKILLWFDKVSQFLLQDFRLRESTFSLSIPYHDLGGIAVRIGAIAASTDMSDVDCEDPSGGRDQGDLSYACPECR